jgi:hypothetical protein
MEPTDQMSEAEMRFALNRLREQQNLVAGALVGAAAALVGAAIWAVITALTEYQIGWMAVGVGFLVAYAVRVAGKGIDKIFGVVGALLSLVGCIVGNLLTTIYFIAKTEDISFLDVLADGYLFLCVRHLYRVSLRVSPRNTRRPQSPTRESCLASSFNK